MELSRKPMAIFYLEENRAVFYGSNIPQILSLDLPVEVVNDLEVIDKEKLSSLLQSFIQSNKIEPANLIILLSTAVTFEKDFQDFSSEELDEETQKFIELVPFQEIESKKIKIDKKWKVVVINKDFCNAFKSGLEKQGFTVTAFIPASVLQETMPELASNLDLNIILNKIELVKQYSILSKQETTRVLKTEIQKKQQNKKMLVLYAIFGFLLLILIILILTNVMSKPSPKSRTIKNTGPSVIPTLPMQETIINSSGAGVLTQPTIQPKKPF